MVKKKDSKLITVNSVLLVDDNPSTNFLNKKLLAEIAPETTVFEIEDAMDLLQFLKNEKKYKSGCPKPGIIFLDINMPKMDGFEFLMEYEKLKEDVKKDILIVILTTSIWSKDKKKAFDSEYIYDFVEKPLTQEKYARIESFYVENYAT